MTIISLNADLIVSATGGVAILDPLGLIIISGSAKGRYSPTLLFNFNFKGDWLFSWRGNDLS
jgi:hypothetical protein